MHLTTKLNMRHVIKKHLSHISKDNGSQILEVGARLKTYQRLFHDMYLSYDVCDIKDGPRVTRLMPAPYEIPFQNDSFDLVIYGQMLEHCYNPFRCIAEMKRVLKPECFIVLIVPSKGHIHTRVDCWRFMRDAWKAISEEVGLHIVDSWIDEETYWGDNVFVGRKPSILL